jgi:hypothetical protein
MCTLAQDAMAALLPYHASFSSSAARKGSDLQAFLHDETLSLLKTVFPRLMRGYLRKHLRAPKVECLMLLASSNNPAASPRSSSLAAATNAAPASSVRSKRKPEVGDDGNDSDPLDILDENSEDQVRSLTSRLSATWGFERCGSLCTRTCLAVVHVASERR